MDQLGYTQRGVIRYEQMIVRFYNALACDPVEALDEIPPEKREILAHLDYKPIVEPMIAADLRKGLSQRFLADRYGVTRDIVRGVRAKYGIE